MGHAFLFLCMRFFVVATAAAKNDIWILQNANTGNQILLSPQPDRFFFLLLKIVHLFWDVSHCYFKDCILRWCVHWSLWSACVQLVFWQRFPGTQGTEKTNKQTNTHTEMQKEWQRHTDRYRERETETERWSHRDREREKDRPLTIFENWCCARTRL